MFSQSRIVAAGLGLALIGCGADQTPSVVDTPAPPPTRLVIGSLVGVDNWNPYQSMDLTADELLSQLYPRLMIELPFAADGSARMRPNLASSWTPSEDGTSLTFELQANANWSDGTPLSAADVVYSWTLQMSDEVYWVGIDTKTSLISVEAVGDKTVRFTFDHPYPSQLLDANEGLIVPEHLFSTIPLESWQETDWAAIAISAGPYRLESQAQQQEIVLTANPGFWGKAPALQELVVRIVPDQNGLATQLESGDLDFVRGIPTTAAAHLETSLRLRVESYEDLSYGLLGFNLADEKLANTALREAIARAVDRQGLVDGTLGSNGRVGTGPVLSSQWAVDTELELPAFDNAAAIEILDSAGIVDSDGDGFRELGGEALELEILTNAESQTRRDMAGLIVEQLARIGIAATTSFVDYGLYLDRLDRAESQLFLTALVASTEVELASTWHSESGGGAGFNWFAYDNPEVDRLLAEVERAETSAEQLPLFIALQRLIVADTPAIFVYESRRYAAFDPNLHHVDLSLPLPFDGLRDWSFQE